MSGSGHFFVAVYTILSWDDFIPGRFHPCSKHQDEVSSGDELGKKCHVNGLPTMKVPCVNSVCEGMGEMISTRAGRLLSQDPRMKKLM